MSKRRKEKYIYVYIYVFGQVGISKACKKKECPAMKKERKKEINNV